MNKLKSLTIFFPFLNDEGMVRRQIHLGFNIGKNLTNDLEIIAIHGGKSKDNTYTIIKEMKKIYPKLIVINKNNNKEGYAVIKHGFKNATKEWIFYTDGDAQYHLEEDLPRLVQKQFESGADIVNGYKKKRNDHFLRRLCGFAYAKLSKIIFQLPIRDVDCDFRLIRRRYLDKINIESHDSSILPEMIKKLQLAGAKFTEVAVSHYSRAYGTSNYNVFLLFKEKLISDLKLYLKLKKPA